MPKFLLLLLCGCSLMMGAPKNKSAKGAHYYIDFKVPEWVLNTKVEDRSDYVWTNTRDGRILLSNSFCGQFQDEALEKLAARTFKMVDGIKIEKQDYTTLLNREAFRLEGTGKVDGVDVGLKLLNTRRNNCYFDFVSIIPLDTASADTGAFDAFLNSVIFK